MRSLRIDQIDVEPLHAPVFVRAQQLADLRNIFEVRNAQQNDRPVA